MKTVIVATILALSMFAAKAEAGNYWINASSCVLDPPSVSKAISTGGTIKHGSGQSGNMVLYCPIPSTLGFTPLYLGMIYSTQGNTSNDYVSAAINRMSVTTGLLSNDTPFYNTNTSATPTYGWKTWGVTWDPTSYIYWIRVDINRAPAGCVSGGVSVPCAQTIFALRVYN